uniref:NAD(P)(+)--arginine ADP-ribosyltransferase n=1 Tax=Arcella intermedia TaxID=1963864 RepID=A0A6B2L0U2_9EUKA
MFLASKQIDDAGALVVSSILFNSTSIQQLYLNDNPIGPEGAKSLADSLEKNTTLCELYLEGNQIGDIGLMYLCKALQLNTTLKQLDLNNNQIGEEGSKYISDMLERNSTLLILDLKLNEIGPEGLRLLSHSFSINNTLNQLVLHTNSIGAKGAQEVANILLNNSSLKQLDLFYNNIGDEGARHISEALKKNSTLNHLDLGYNNIGDIGASYLSDAIKMNSSLTLLNLEANKITSDGVIQIRDALKLNSTMILLDLDGPNELKQDIQSKLNHNNSIRRLHSQKPFSLLIASSNPTPSPSIPPPINTPSVPSEQKLEYQRLKFSNDEENMRYKGVLEITKNFQPTKKCKEYVLQLADLENCHKFPFIVQEVEYFMESLGGFTSNLSQDEIFSIALYSWDIRPNGSEEENFYYVLNIMLRKRILKLMEQLSGYLYYMQSALSKLDSFVGKVYRGINQRDYIQNHYTQGRRIHWSSYSSTTKDIKVAKEFAHNEGVVMQLDVLNGKSIHQFSRYGGEWEILLSPNMIFIVTKAVHYYEKGGYYRICLSQQAPNDTFVF